MRVWLFVGLVFCQGCASAIHVSDLRVPVPRGFTLNDSKDGSWATLTNFQGHYYNGGIVPREGAEISIFTWSTQSIELEHAMHLDTENCAESLRVGVQINGRKAAKIVCEEDYGFRVTETKVYIDHGPVIYKLTLSYNSDDPKQAQFEQIFMRLQNGLSFKRHKRVDP